MAIGVALLLAGPGRLSLDRLFGIRVPAALGGLFAAGVAAASLAAVWQPRGAGQSSEQPAPAAPSPPSEPRVSITG